MSKLDHYYETMSIAETLRGYDSYDPEYKAAIDDLAETFLSESRRLEETRMEENRLLDDSRRMEDRRQLQRMDEDRHAYEKRLVEIQKLDEKIQEEKAKLKAEQEGTTKEDKKDQQKMSDKLSKNVKLGELKGVANVDGRKCAVVENVVKMKGYQWNRTHNCMEKKDFYVRTGTYTAFDLQTGKKVDDRFRLEESQVSDDKIAMAAVSRKTGKSYEIMKPEETDRVKAEIRIQQDEEYKQTAKGISR